MKSGESSDVIVFLAATDWFPRVAARHWMFRRTPAHELRSASAAAKAATLELMATASAYRNVDFTHQRRQGTLAAVLGRKDADSTPPHPRWISAIERFLATPKGDLDVAWALGTAVSIEDEHAGPIATALGPQAWAFLTPYVRNLELVQAEAAESHSDWDRRLARWLDEGQDLLSSFYAAEFHGYDLAGALFSAWSGQARPAGGTALWESASSAIAALGFPPVDPGKIQAVCRHSFEGGQDADGEGP